jgi:hypothetical protein
MAYEFQVAIDCERPHELADWWAETLGWVVWSSGAAIKFPGEVESRGPHPRVLFQVVPESKSVKNRLHFDVGVGPENVESAVKALTERGAVYLHTAAQGPHTWVTMADPEGNEFCVT